MISEMPQMMYSLFMNQRTKYISLQTKELILMDIMQFPQPDYTIKLLDAKDEYRTDVFRAKLTRDVAVLSRRFALSSSWL